MIASTSLRLNARSGIVECGVISQARSYSEVFKGSLAIISKDGV